MIGNIWNTWQAFSRCHGFIIECNIDRCRLPMVRCHGTKVTGDITTCQTPFSYCFNLQHSGNIDVLLRLSAGANKVRISDGDISNVGSTPINNVFWGLASIVLENCTLDGADRFPLRVYTSGGDFLPLQSGDADWVVPPSGMNWILQATPNSYCSQDWRNQMELSPIEDMSDYVSAGSKTITFKIFPVGWATPLDQDDILLEAKYLDSVSGITRTTIVTPAGTFNNNGWRDLAVSFAPGQAGIVYFNLFIRRYELDAYVLIDPKWRIS